MKYTAETAKALTNEKLVDEFVEAHKDNIAKPAPNFSILKTELLDRLNTQPASKGG